MFLFTIHIFTYLSSCLIILNILLFIYLCLYLFIGWHTVLDPTIHLCPESAHLHEETKQCKKWENVESEEQWLQFNALPPSILSVLDGNINFRPNLKS